MNKQVLYEVVVITDDNREQVLALEHTYGEASDKMHELMGEVSILDDIQIRKVMAVGRAL